jgi:hypothetical protein
MDDQHFATHADLERVRAGLIDRIGQLEVRMVERMAQLEVRLIERMADLEVRLVERIEQSEKRTLRWLASLFIAQTFVLVVPCSA